MFLLKGTIQRPHVNPTENGAVITEQILPWEQEIEKPHTGTGIAILDLRQGCYRLPGLGLARPNCSLGCADF